MRLNPAARRRLAQAQDLAAHGMRVEFADLDRAPRARRDPGDRAEATPALVRAARYLAQPAPRRHPPGRPARPGPPVARTRLTPAQARRLCRKDLVGAPDRAAFLASITDQVLTGRARELKLARRRAAAAAKRAAAKETPVHAAPVVLDPPTAGPPVRVPPWARGGPAKPGDPPPSRTRKRPRSNRKRRARA